MRPWSRRLGVVIVSTAVVSLATALPARAAEPLSCRASVHVDWSTSGPFNAVVTATVYGECTTPAWTTCLVTLSGVPGVAVSSNTADYGGCVGSVTMVGVQNTLYIGVGRVGYSADDVSTAAAVGYGFPTTLIRKP